MTCFFPFWRRLPLWLFCRSASSQDAWVSSVQDALQDECGMCLPEQIRQALLWDKQDDFWLYVDQLDEDPQFLVKGLPRKPLYVEVGHRLKLLASYKNEKIPLLLPAEHFGLSERAFDMSCESLLALIPDRPTKRSMMDWINHAGASGIFTILGIRNTIGTDPRNLLPPSCQDLLEAAALPHKEKCALSVAARARSKHAHRGKDQFFGVASGPPQQQNDETQQILIGLLQNAAWINIHTFGGHDGEPFLEVRVASGYGARWKADWTTDPVCPSNVSFRGFLEPQMPGGHERKWRH